MLVEPILFPDGSTLQLQGIERGRGASARTIVGGSGQFLGATGVADIAPTADFAMWKKTITFGKR